MCIYIYIYTYVYIYIDIYIYICVGVECNDYENGQPATLCSKRPQCGPAPELKGLRSSHSLCSKAGQPATLCSKRPPCGPAPELKGLPTAVAAQQQSSKACQRATHFGRRAAQPSVPRSPVPPRRLALVVELTHVCAIDPGHPRHTVRPHHHLCQHTGV